MNEENNQRQPEDDPEWLKTVRANRDYAAEQFDKLVVYISSGALVLTIGFVKDIIDITSKTNTVLLKLSWISFTLALLTILLSQITSVKAMDYQLDYKESKAKRWDKATDWLNWMSVGLLISGIILFIVFIWTNV
ncbi:MAG: hypothetical protein ABJH72_17450 [Reichenbachiella sp.]|uniref:hypothetical protein n=1 Tax=Reichenbachiella sp. TaxID=2184521 RepID=UPI0032975481